MTTAIFANDAGLTPRPDAWTRRLLGPMSIATEKRMRAAVRHAGLKQDQEQRVRIAAGALAANSIVASASPWDGTRCDLVLLHADDGYGQHVMQIARRRGVEVIALSATRTGREPGVNWIREDSSAAVLARQMAALLLGDRAPESPSEAAGEAAAASASEVPASNASEVALVRLSEDPSLAGKDVEARIAGRTVFLLPSSGRVLSATLSDQFATRDRLGEAGWQFRPARKGDIESNRFEFSGSLEAFLLQGALQQARQLPRFPAQPCSLQDWPDLGTTPDAVDALRVVQALQSRALTPATIASECRLDPAYVSACLWAFAAAGLLHRSPHGAAAAMPVTTPMAKPVLGVFARLAAHFGLGRAG